MNIYKLIDNQNHISAEQKEAVSTIISEWDEYRYCQRKAKSMGKYHLTLRKLFYKNTGVMLPIMCWWATQEDLLNQFNIS